MADNENQSAVETVREELKNLRAQLESAVKNIEDKRQELTADMAQKIAREVEHARRMATERAHRLREVSEHGLGEVETQVRKNPLASLLIAFGLGWVLSCFIRHLR